MEQPAADSTAVPITRGAPPWWIWTPSALMILVYLPTLRDLVLDWYHDGNYSHGFLIPLISAYFLWHKRQSLAAIPKRVDRVGLILVIAAMALFVVANAGAEYFTLRLSFILTLLGLVFYVFGRSVVRLAWFEIGLLVFMIPIPYVVYYAATFPLQLLVSKVTASLLVLLGADVVRQGNIIHLAGVSLEVAEACSGMRSLMTLLALGAIYAQVSQTRSAAKVILFLSSIPIAIAANVARVLATSLLAYAVGGEVTQEPLHTIMGLLVFVVAFVALTLTALVLRRIWR